MKEFATGRAEEEEGKKKAAPVAGGAAVGSSKAEGKLREREGEDGSRIGGNRRELMGFSFPPLSLSLSLSLVSRCSRDVSARKNARRSHSYSHHVRLY